jgi:hypothetical protein
MRKKAKKKNAVYSDLLLLPDGRILVQDLTRSMARLLQSLNPKSEVIAPRAVISTKL